MKFVLLVSAAVAVFGAESCATAVGTTGNLQAGGSGGGTFLAIWGPAGGAMGPKVSTCTATEAAVGAAAKTLADKCLKDKPTLIFYTVGLAQVKSVTDASEMKNMAWAIRPDYEQTIKVGDKWETRKAAGICAAVNSGTATTGNKCAVISIPKFLKKQVDYGATLSPAVTITTSDGKFATKGCSADKYVGGKQLFEVCIAANKCSALAWGTYVARKTVTVPANFKVEKEVVSLFDGQAVAADLSYAVNGAAGGTTGATSTAAPGDMVVFTGFKDFPWQTDQAGFAATTLACVATGFTALNTAGMAIVFTAKGVGAAANFEAKGSDLCYKATGCTKKADGIVDASFYNIATGEKWTFTPGVTTNAGGKFANSKNYWDNSNNLLYTCVTKADMDAGADKKYIIVTGSVKYTAGTAAVKAKMGKAGSNYVAVMKQNPAAGSSGSIVATAFAFVVSAIAFLA